MSVLELLIWIGGIGLTAIIIIGLVQEYWHVIVSIVGIIILILVILFVCGFLDSIILDI